MKIYILLFILSFFAFSALAEKTFTLIAEDDWKPYSSLKNGEIKGLSIDLITEAYKSQNMLVKFKSKPYSRCMMEAMTINELGCFNTLKDDLLEQKYLFPKSHLFESTISIYATLENVSQNLTHLDLDNKKVGFTNGYTYGNKIEKNEKIKKHFANTDLANLNKLINKRIDYVLIYEEVLEQLLVENPNLKNKIKKVGTLGPQKLYISFSKKNPLSNEAIKYFDNGMDEIKKNGTYALLMKKWVNIKH